MTKNRSLGGLNNKNLFSRSFGGSLRSRCQQGWCQVRALSLGCRWPPPLCVLTWPFFTTLKERGREKERESMLSGVSLTRTLILLDQGLTLMISFNFNYFPRAIISTCHHIGGYSLNLWICGGHIQFITASLSWLSSCPALVSLLSHSGSLGLPPK